MKGWPGPKRIMWDKQFVGLEQAKTKSDLSKFDPIYDDISENSSVIKLWKRQKAKELNATPAEKKMVDAMVEEEHGIVEVDELDDDYTPPRTTRPDELLENEDDMEQDEVTWSADLKIPMAMFKQLQKKTLIIKRTVQMTRNGKIPTMYALVVVGNGNGAAGFGEGRGQETSKAVLNATRKAIKDIQMIPRYDDRTIYHDIDHKFKATKLLLWARRPGFGLRVAPIIHEVCQCVGIKDLAGKIHKSRNPMNVIKAVFEALQTQRQPEDVAKARGIRLVDVNHTYYGTTNPTPQKYGKV
ncbi:28S ribosomal protein S5, mitochondrial [Coemansia guatemalensis]|uniref:Small ribosomal subunit protein uS5m n=1 Tax=Coemansia guatemalensis TaxID=2761395 RepID=A0A9W8HZM2_9FUNG|nr:28S ribosomal protein S5, mitochondrial [Coemansia guatemalensis]